MSSNTASYSDIVSSFNMAVSNPENIRKGVIDWNFVDADIHLDASEAGMALPEEYPDIFDGLADNFLSMEDDYCLCGLSLSKPGPDCYVHMSQGY